MTTFTLDTSGAVYLTNTKWVRSVEWRDLDAFTQGYVEALFQTVVPVRDDGATVEMCLWEVVGFSDLSPEALAAILADCAEFNLKIGDASHNAGIGAQFWKARQAGFNAHWSLHQKEFVAAFPPLTASLDDNGKVQLS